MTTSVKHDKDHKKDKKDKHSNQSTMDVLREGWKRLRVRLVKRSFVQLFRLLIRDYCIVEIKIRPIKYIISFSHPVKGNIYRRKTDNNNNNERTSRAPFHVKHVQLR